MKGISVLSASPDLLWAFACGFLVTAGIAIWVANNGNLIAAKLGFTLGVSVAGGVLGAGLLTIVALLIDDWSACRLMPCLALLYGYPLYSTPQDPANAFAYGPFGAWVYLPAALIAKLLLSPTLGLLAGVLISFILLFLPVCIIILRSKTQAALKFLGLLLAGVLFVSLPPLRYVAFSVHVDAVGLFASALAILSAAKAIAPSAGYSWFCGLAIAIAVLSKQTFIPVGAVCLLLLSLSGIGALLRSFVSFLLTVICVLGVLKITGSIEGMFDLYFKFFSGVPSRMGIV
jgi:hypothetical protein